MSDYEKPVENFTLAELRFGIVIQRNKIDELKARIAELEAWLQWCLDNCDDSPEFNFGTDATELMRKLLAGEDIEMPTSETGMVRR